MPIPVIDFPSSNPVNPHANLVNAFMQGFGGAQGLYGNYLNQKYMPIQKISDALSKSTYANMVMPQATLKALENPNIAAQIPDDAKRQLLQSNVSSLSGNADLQNQLADAIKNVQGGGGGGILSKLFHSGQTGQNIPGIGSQMAPENNQSQINANSSSDMINNLRDSLMKEFPNNPVMQKVALSQATVESGLTGEKPSLLATKYNNPFGIKAKKGSANSVSLPTTEIVNGKPQIEYQTFAKYDSLPDAVDAYNNTISKNHKNVLSSISVEDAAKALQDSNYATDKDYANKVVNASRYLDNSNASQDQQQPSASWNQNISNYNKTTAQGEETGKQNAKRVAELGTVVSDGKLAQSNIDEMSKMASSPVFESIKQHPLAGHSELWWYSKNGTPEQQQAVGEFYSRAGQMVTDMSHQFKGQFRVGEQALIDRMKPNPADSIDVIRGKLKSLSYMNQVFTKRADMTSDLMNEGLTESQALKVVDKQINTDQIKKHAGNMLDFYNVKYVKDKTGKNVAVKKVGDKWVYAE